MSRAEMTDFDLLALAAEHTAAGLPSLPVVLIEQEDGTTAKIPATRGCRGYLDATVDDEKFLRDVTFARKIGTALAAGRRWCIGVGVVPGDGDAIILDCDVKHGSLGLETLETLKARYGNEIEAVRWRSISGGVNLALRKPRRRISNRAPKDWIGIDTRADSGFVVAPGTWTPWGEWAWEQGEWSDLGVMPDEMAAELPDASPDGKDVPPVDRHEVVAFLAGSPRTSSPAAQTAFNAKLTELQAMTTGNRHPKLVNVVGWTFGMRALNLDKAMQDIDSVWGGLLRPDEVHRRAGEAWEVAHWVAEREIHNRTIDQATSDRSSALVPQRSKSGSRPWSANGIIRTMATAEEGTRNATLAWAAHRIGSDVSAGRACRQAADRACEELEFVARRAGLGHKETVATISSGYAAGLHGRGCRS